MPLVLKRPGEGFWSEHVEHVCCAVSMGEASFMYFSSPQTLKQRGRSAGATYFVFYDMVFGDESQVIRACSPILY
jgi:hypothetical protein